MLNYYVFDKQTPENKDFYFNNEGIFNFWNNYLLIHINDCNLVIVNKPKRKFHGSITEDERALIKDRIKKEFCCDKGCTVNTTSSDCEIKRDWGQDICNFIWN